MLVDEPSPSNHALGLSLWPVKIVLLNCCLMVCCLFVRSCSQFAGMQYTTFFNASAAGAWIGLAIAIFMSIHIPQFWHRRGDGSPDSPLLKTMSATLSIGRAFEERYSIFGMALSLLRWSLLVYDHTTGWVLRPWASYTMEIGAPLGCLPVIALILEMVIGDNWASGFEQYTRLSVLLYHVLLVPGGLLLLPTVFLPVLALTSNLLQISWDILYDVINQIENTTDEHDWQGEMDRMTQVKCDLESIWMAWPVQMHILGLLVAEHFAVLVGALIAFGSKELWLLGCFFFVAASSLLLMTLYSISMVTSWITCKGNGRSVINAIRSKRQVAMPLQNRVDLMELLYWLENGDACVKLLGIGVDDKVVFRYLTFLAGHTPFVYGAIMVAVQHGGQRW